MREEGRGIPLWRSQYRIGCFGVLLEQLDSLRSRQQHELDLAAFGFVLHLFHHRQSAVCPGADDELATFPRDLFLYCKRGVAGSVTKLLGWSFLPFADFTAINDDVILAGRTVDP